MVLPKSLLPCCLFLSSCFLHYPIPKFQSSPKKDQKIIQENPLNQARDSTSANLLSNYLIHKTLRISIGYPSASAGIMCNGNWWVLGDDAQSLLVISERNDSPYLYHPLPFHRELEKREKESLHTRIKKGNKMDFEALAQYLDANGFYHIWAFGSGSKSPWRDTGLYWNFHETNTFPITQQPYKINLAPLYEVLQRRSQISPEKWNIEGACVDPTDEGTLILLNRTPAALIRIPLRDWFRYLEIGSIPLAENIQVRTYILPEIDGYSAGFSGATFDISRKSIWFSSSVEISDNPISDGTILGSFIGEISLRSGEINRTPLRVPEDVLAQKNTKLESLCLDIIQDPLSRKFRGTVDNDDGSSELLLVDMRLNHEIH